MKTKIIFLGSAVLIGMLAISATTEISKQKQCGVTNQQITTYLQECSHHHTVFSVSDIPGTCNSLAEIENCGTATVYVSGGIVIGHTDAGGFCD